MKLTKVFLDSSVIMAGLASRTGGSHQLLLLTEMQLIKPYISEYVVSEVIRNVEKKLPQCRDYFFLLFRKLPFRFVDPAEKAKEIAAGLINDKDSPVLAAAITARVDYLISLDKHFSEILQESPLCFQINTPSQFLSGWPKL